MNQKELLTFVKKHLDDNKALKVTELDVTKLSNCMDMMIIATGTSTRHVQSIAKKLITAVKEAGHRPLGVEGETLGDWVLVDLGDVIVHVMLQSQRDFYDLEKLWTATKTLKRATKAK